MSQGEIRIAFNCNKCGDKILELADDYDELLIANCQSCGTEFGTWGELRARAMKVRQTFQDALKERKGWKVM